MVSNKLTGLMAYCGAILLPTAAFAAEAPIAAQTASVASQDQAPEVPPAKPGVFSLQKKGAVRFHLAVAGHTFTSRDSIEKYLLYRTAEVTLDQRDSWFTLIEARAKGDTVPPSKPDPAGLRYSFRLTYWRPIWRFKLAGKNVWINWSPFSGVAFPVTDPKAISAFEVSADVVVHKGIMNDADPLAFDASAISDLLVNQVSPPE